MASRLRVRWVVLAGCALSAAAAVGSAYVAAMHAVRSALEEARPAERAAALDAVGQAVLAAGGLALAAAVFAGLWLGGVLDRPLERLRLQILSRARGGTGAARGQTALLEVERLGEAADLLARETRERIAEAVWERDEMARLVESVNDGIVQLAGDGRVTWLNPAAQTLLELPRDAVGKPITALVRHPELRAAFGSAVAVGVVESQEVSLGERRLLVSAGPLGVRAGTGVARAGGEAGGGGARAGRASGAVILVVDLTELRRLEGVRRDFVANASHELKTPLTSIRGYTETLLGDDLPADVRRQFLETVAKNAERLQRIVDDLLDLSRIESGRWSPELVEVDPVDAAEDAWSTLRERAKRGGVTFSILAPDRPPALADPDGLRQIFANLFDNALRYTSPGGRITVRIVTSVEPEASPVDQSAPPTNTVGAPGGGAEERAWIVVEVKDTGSGIPQAALPRIFERFYRVDPARSRAEGGTGLGLSIVKHLVEGMGGDVTAASELGKGTTIRLRLSPAPVPAGSARSGADEGAGRVRAE